MKRIVFLLLILIVSIQTVHGHNPLSAMYYLEVKDGINILNINLSQDGLNAALRKHFPKIKFEKISKTEFKQLTVSYLKNNFHLDINGSTIDLLEGGIKLGSHQTDAKFMVSSLPETFKKLNVSIKAFAENEQHQTVFSLLLNGKTSKVILNKNNDYTASVNFKNSLMVVSSKTFNKNYLWCFVLVPIFLFVKSRINKESTNT
ncbi:hypothetical protein [Psychroserpens ponticola]|uniref:Uncharacterized protein n=1 Tax=Psychroserpens ponticola TaxID=2932268 RepID=A0ABY7RVD1_9FLAO|nr:hypothetical protein [Psychroserpens ponticola]WCO00650.1 hypothetical protein MUN68_011290 [Psychroserpens ponticola]